MKLSLFFLGAEMTAAMITPSMDSDPTNSDASLSKLSLPFVANSSTVSSFVNLTLPIDPDFDIATHGFQGPNIPAISFLMNAMNAMLYLVLSGPDAQLPSAAWSMKNFPEVQIAIRPTRVGGTVDRQFLIWGLYESIYTISRRNVFRECVIDLLWKNVLVGHIKYRAPPIPTLNGSVSNNETQGILPEDLNSTLANVTTTAPLMLAEVIDADAQLSVDIDYPGHEPLFFVEVFLSVISMMSDQSGYWKFERVSETMWIAPGRCSPAYHLLLAPIL